MPSIFSNIVNGTIPSTKVYEDDHTFAFMDINPASRGHVLVICKDEYPDLLALPEPVLLATARTTQRVARAVQAALQPDGINIVQNNGAAAGQVVFHYHVHIIPRWEHDGALRLWTPQTPDAAELNTIAEHLRQALADTE